MKVRIYTSTPMMHNSGRLPKRTSQCKQKKKRENKKKKNVVSEKRRNENLKGMKKGHNVMNETIEKRKLKKMVRILNGYLLFVLLLLATTVAVEVHRSQAENQSQETKKGVSPSQSELSVHAWSSERNHTTCDTADDVVGCEGAGGICAEGIDEVCLNRGH